MLLGLGLQLFAVFDGYRIAKSSDNYELQWYNKPLIYFGIAAAIIGLSFLIESIATGELLPETPAVESYRTASVSMFPTLRPRERFFADMRHYKKNPPQRGELVVFKYPDNPDLDYVKRIIAIGGDTISIVDGIVILNGEAVTTTESGFTHNQSEDLKMEILTETMANSRSYNIVKTDPNSRAANFEEVTVPENHFFVMGDNRDNSNDSRYTVGFVRNENLKGRASFIYWPEDWSRFGLKLN